MVPLPHEFKEISPDLMINEKYLRDEFSNTTDIVFREFYMSDTRCLAVWVDGLTNNRVSHDLFRALMLDSSPEKALQIPAPQRMDYISQHLLPFYATIPVKDMIELKRWLLMAKLILLVDLIPTGLVLDAESPPARSVSESINEAVVMGPRDSFVEPLRINTALIREKLGDSRLKSENYIIGRRTNTLVTLMFIDDIADPDIIQEARRRLTRIDIDGVLDSSYIKEMIQDRPFSLFPLMKSTERPDKVAADLLEGRFAIIVEGSPQVLTAPTIFNEFIQSAEDYYQNPVVAWAARCLRILAMFFAIGVPAAYVAITTFHQEMIPINLAFTIAGSRETVPFPAFIEALGLLFFFELLWEAGVRLPRVVGGAVSIVGALILGQGAVQAGLVSQAMTIVIAIAAIANFALGSAYELASAIRVLRVICLIAGSVLGFYGLGLVFLGVMVHMAGLRSFGVQYMEPYMPLRIGELGDTIYRAPRWAMSRRPSYIAGDSLIRNRTDKPLPPTDE